MDIRPKNRSVNISKITLDIGKIQTLPPKPKSSPRKIVKPRVPRQPPQSQQRIKKNTDTQKVEKKSPPPKKAEKFQVAKGTDKKEFLETKSTITTQTRENNISKTVQKKPSKVSPKKKQPSKSTAKKSVPKKNNPRKRRNVKHSNKASRTAQRRVYQPSKRNRSMINSLYGSSYSRMSSTQRKFIDDNLRKIMIISQRTLNYLGYPRTAVRMGQQGTNIVQFWLHPNGDISGLRLRRRIGSESLDRQTIEVIKTAYMYYPRPRTKTKIIIYVKYRLY